MPILRRMQVVGAWGFWTIFGQLYDNGLYPLVIWRFGPFTGGGMMAIGSLAICFYTLIWYERKKIDWFGVDIIENIKKNGQEHIQKLRKKASGSVFWTVISIVLYPLSRIFVVVLWALRKNDVAAFVALNIYQDPFITTIFLRHGQFNGLKRRDWIIFFGSILFSNVYWITRTTILVELIKISWRSL